MSPDPQANQFSRWSEVLAGIASSFKETSARLESEVKAQQAIIEKKLDDQQESLNRLHQEQTVMKIQLDLLTKDSTDRKTARQNKELQDADIAKNADNNKTEIKKEQLKFWGIVATGLSATFLSGGGVMYYLVQTFVKPPAVEQIHTNTERIEDTEKEVAKFRDCLKLKADEPKFRACVLK